MEELATVIANAARKAFKNLFANGESFYYCTLFTTGEGHEPYISAWSWEALEREANNPTTWSRDSLHKGKIDNVVLSKRKELMKWSYVDSPYYCSGEEHFQYVKKLFEARPSSAQLDEEKWLIEWQLRLEAMELAMKILDKEGLFSLNQARELICILVEVMPPDEINTQIAKRLNEAYNLALQSWLSEAAE
ncbi:DUF4303 domain-containing protein [Ornithinibacillus sp. 4-3]|uniref:DUF4303 domain-containing protein n=1 Tax=Ornithinibacillus sp. 4-3 TaxID=3231488 RepID=A0AB39HVM7_9BACI